MQAFSLNDLLAMRSVSGKLYHEFLRVPALSAGIYALAAGATDPQKPHGQDEIYYVIRGRAHIRVGDEDALSSPTTRFTWPRMCPTNSTASPKT